MSVQWPRRRIGPDPSSPQVMETEEDNLLKYHGLTEKGLNKFCKNSKIGKGFFDMLSQEVVPLKKATFSIDGNCYTKELCKYFYNKYDGKKKINIFTNLYNSRALNEDEEAVIFRYCPFIPPSLLVTHIENPSVKIVKTFLKGFNGEIYETFEVSYYTGDIYAEWQDLDKNQQDVYGIWMQWLGTELDMEEDTVDSRLELIFPNYSPLRQKGDVTWFTPNDIRSPLVQVSMTDTNYEAIIFPNIVYTFIGNVLDIRNEEDIRYMTDNDIQNAYIPAEIWHKNNKYSIEELDSTQKDFNDIFSEMEKKTNREEAFSSDAELVRLEYYIELAIFMKSIVTEENEFYREMFSKHIISFKKFKMLVVLIAQEYANETISEDTSMEDSE